MAAEPFVLGLTSLAEFYACNLATGRGEDLNVRKAMETSVEKMVSDLARVKLKIAESSALLVKLAEVDLPDWIKVQLHDAINANTDDSRVRGKFDTPKVSQQKHNFLYHYLTAKDWEVLRMQHCMDLRIKTVLRRCALFGLLHPTENTMVLIACVLLLSAPGWSMEKVVAEEFMALLRDCKCVLKHVRKGFAIQGPEEYPPTPTLFQQTHERLWRAAYETEQAVECQVNVEELLALARAMPARKNHASLLSVRIPNITFNRAAPNVVLPFDAPAMMSMFVQQFLQQQQQQPPMHQQRAFEPILRLCPSRSSFALTGEIPPTPVSESRALVAPNTPVTPTPSVTPLHSAPRPCAAELLPSPLQPPQLPQLPNSFGQQTLAESVGVAKPVAKQSVEGMTADILTALRERGGQKGKPSVMKRPAASLGTSDAESPPPAKKPLAKQLAAQGAAPEQLKENPPTGKLPPMRIDQATIYFNCAKECWRVKLRPGDRLDKPFSWRGDEKQRREQWLKVLAYCKGTDAA